MTVNSSVGEQLLWCSFEDEDVDGDDGGYLSPLRYDHNLDKSFCFGACGQRNFQWKLLSFILCDSIVYFLEYI